MLHYLHRRPSRASLASLQPSTASSFSSTIPPTGFAHLLGLFTISDSSILAHLHLPTRLQRYPPSSSFSQGWSPAAPSSSPIMPSKRFWRTDDKPPPYSRTQQHQRQQQSTSDNDPKDIALQDRGPTASSSSEPDVLSPVGTAQSQQALSNNGSGAGGYRTYKRRWFGLVQMTLMNIVVSWGVSVSRFPFLVFVSRS